MKYISQAVALLKVHEGYERYPYKCSMGVVTIGYGRNLESRGLTEEEAAYLLQCDVKLAEGELLDQYDYYWNLSGERKAVLIDMMVNLGSTRLRKFKKMHLALDLRDYSLAAVEMLDSRWARQVGQRSKTLAQIMITNKI
jgi:lysozyme